MKLIFGYTILSIVCFTFFGCRNKFVRLSYYKIDNIYVSSYKKDPKSVDDIVERSNVFSDSDSVLIGISFDILFCDSTKRKFVKEWMPTRGYFGIIDKIKSISIHSQKKDKYDSVSINSLYLVNDSLSYEVYKEGAYGRRANSLDRGGCKMSLTELIEKINDADKCFVNNSLNTTYLLYSLDKKEIHYGENTLVFEFEFENYSITKTLILKFPANREYGLLKLRP